MQRIVSWLMSKLKQAVLSLGFVQTWLNKRYQRAWRKANAHNLTTPLSYYPLDLVKIGKCTYGKVHILSARYEQLLHIGSYCSIADEVTFILSAGHPLNHLSTYPFKAMLMNEPEATAKGDIVIEDDVWIGYRVTVLSGVHIGRGAVIASGAVVTKDIPPYAISAGVPAKVVKYRFEKEIIEKLMTIDFDKLNDLSIADNLGDLYEVISTNNVNTIVDKINNN